MTKIKLFEIKNILTTLKLWLIDIIVGAGIIIFTFFIEPESKLGLIILLFYFIFALFFRGFLVRKIWGWGQ